MKEPEAAQNYRTIDGNYARAVIGYCQYYKGYVTAKQAKVHRCHLKHGGVCPRLQNMEGRSIRKVKTEQFYDKIVSRLDNLIGAVNKLTRTIEAMEKWRNGMCISLTDGDVPKEEDIKKALEAMQKGSKNLPTDSGPTLLLGAGDKVNNYAKEKEDMGP